MFGYAEIPMSRGALLERAQQFVDKYVALHNESVEDFENLPPLHDVVVKWRSKRARRSYASFRPRKGYSVISLAPHHVSWGQPIRYTLLHELAHLVSFNEAYGYWRISPHGNVFANHLATLIITHGEQFTAPLFEYWKTMDRVMDALKLYGAEVYLADSYRKTQDMMLAAALRRERWDPLAVALFGKGPTKPRRPLDRPCSGCAAYRGVYTVRIYSNFEDRVAFLDVPDETAALAAASVKFADAERHMRQLLEEIDPASGVPYASFVDPERSDGVVMWGAMLEYPGDPALPDKLLWLVWLSAYLSVGGIFYAKDEREAGRIAFFASDVVRDVDLVHLERLVEAAGFGFEVVEWSWECL